MNSEQWLKVKEIFHQAVELAPAERHSFLLERCEDDGEMLRELELLMESHDEAEHFIERPALASASDVLSGDSYYHPGLMIGQYSVLSEIGRGGMGLVLLGVRADNQFNKRVAIKVLRRGMDSEDIMRRFRNERQILASLEHPYIARLLDGGVTADGLPYFVMEYIEGEPLDNYCDKYRLSINERLELFRKVCSAVQYAHQNLVIHRDLKPSNILITSEGAPKLLDFGIAKLLNPKLTSQTFQPTATLMRLMTPEYASPEQIRGRNITTVSDVYSLGILLYRLLTGHAPYRFTQASLQEIEHLVSETEPEKPSTAISRTEEITTGKTTTRITPEVVGEARGESPEALRRRLRGDLDNIVLKAMKKEPERRYSSVAQLSEDIRRYTQGLPITARKDTLAYRASKFIWRHKAGAAAVALVMLAVIAGIIATLLEARIARKQRDAARVAQVKAERISQFLSAALLYSDPAAAIADTKNHRDATINQMLDDIAPRLETELADEPDARASLQRTVGWAYFSQYRIAEAERYLNAALQTQLQIYGAGHQETALTLVAISELQEFKGDYAGAIESSQKAIAIYRNQPPNDQTHIEAFAAVLNVLGDINWTKGDFQTAESAYSESLSVASQLQGTDREPLADAKFGLGTTRYAQGRLDEAAALLRESLDEFHRLPHTRWKWSNTLNFLGQVLTWKNEFDEALNDLHESQRLSLEIWGEDNQYYARSLWVEVYALCFKGDCAAAAEPLNRAEEIYNRIMPDNKAVKANLYDARNIFLTRTGRAREGETFGRQAVELYQSSLNRGAPGITLARINLAESLEAQKKYDEAERVLLEAYKDSSEAQGTQHWRTKTAARALVELYRAWNRPNEAERYQALM